MDNENGVKMYRSLIFLLTVLCPLFSPVVMASQANLNSMGKTATVATSADTGPRAVPPIDRAPPPIYKTATFGLG